MPSQKKKEKKTDDKLCKLKKNTQTDIRENNSIKKKKTKNMSTTWN